MKGISMEDYIKLRVQFEPSVCVDQMRNNIYEVIRAKLEGYTCRQCQQELWAVGSVVAEDYLCHECIGLEPNPENDLEFDIFLEKVF